MEEPSDLIQSVSRALRILEVVGEEPEGLSPKAVARRSGLKLATTYHLLRTLAYEGYLVRDARGDYSIGLEIADRFSDLRDRLGRPPEATAVLRGLAARTGHSAYLARFVDGRVVIATVVETSGSPHLEDLIPGFDEGAHATALGKALLSTLSPADRHAYLDEQGLRPFTDRTVVDAAELDAELSAGSGVFVEQGQFRGSVSCAAALVGTLDPDDPWWAVAVAAASDTFRARRRQLAASLRTAAWDLAC